MLCSTIQRNNERKVQFICFNFNTYEVLKYYTMCANVAMSHPVGKKILSC